MVDTCPHVGIPTCVRVGAPHEPRFARLPRRLLSLSVEFIICLHVCIYVCVRGRAPREPRCARLAGRKLSLIVELICVFMLVFMFVSGVGCLASLASLASLGTRFHCGKERNKARNKVRKK